MKLYTATLKFDASGLIQQSLPPYVDASLPALDPGHIVIAYDRPFTARFPQSDGTMVDLPLLSFEMPEDELKPYEVERDEDGDRRFQLPSELVSRRLAAARMN